MSGGTRLAPLLLALTMLCNTPAGAVGFTSQVLERNQAAETAWVNLRPSRLPQDPLILDAAAEIIGVGGTDLDKVRLVHDWVCQNIYFDDDALERGTYRWLSTREVLEHRYTVCEGVANLTQALLLAQGVPCVKVWGRAVAEADSWTEAELSESRINHTWVAVYVEGHWRNVDPTMDLGGRYSNGTFTPGPWTQTYFDPDPTFFARTHLVLRRGDDQPGEIPDPWAQGEVLAAWGEGLAPLPLFGSYRAPMTPLQWSQLLGLGDAAGEALTRMEGVRLLWRAAGCPPAAREAAYADGADLDQADRAVLAALTESGLLQGGPGDHFCPDEPLTRQEALCLLHRWKGS